MHLITILSGVACACASALAPLSPRRDRRDCMFLAAVLMAAWGATGVAWLFDGIEKLAMMDGAILALSIVLYRAQPRGWRAWFMTMALVQMALDGLYGWFGEGFYDIYWLPYDLAFVGEIVAVSWGGGQHVLDSGRCWLRGFRGLLQPLLVQAR